MKFFCDPVITSWQTASSGLGNWVVTLQLKPQCATDGKITSFAFSGFNLSGFNVQSISGVFNTFKNVPGFGELMGDLNDEVQGAISNAVVPQIRDNLESGLQSLCPIDTQGINLCVL